MNLQRGDMRWQGDQVELLIRAATSGTSLGPGKFTANEYQLEIGPDRDGVLGAFVLMNGSDRVGKMLPGVTVGLQIMPDKQGYTMEARIPWASLGAYRPTKGDRLRWTMNIDFGTPDGLGWDHQVKWMPGIHWDTSTWGVAVLK